MTFRPSASALLGGRRTGAQGDGDIAGARVPKVESVRVTLRTIAYDRDLLVQDASEVGVAIIIDAHVFSPRLVKYGRLAQRRSDKGRAFERFFAVSSRR
jgi:hypothetical protein